MSRAAGVYCGPRACQPLLWILESVTSFSTIDSLQSQQVGITKPTLTDKIPGRNFRATPKATRLLNDQSEDLNLGLSNSKVHSLHFL